jgi:hypothetical protein
MNERPLSEDVYRMLVGADWALADIGTQLVKCEERCMTGIAASIAHEFLAVVWDGDPPAHEVLLQALDRLLARSHEVSFADCADAEDEPPTIDGPALYHSVALRFPDLGMYPVADPLASVEDDKMLADAVDDLADITKDLREVGWRDEHLGADAAAWCFRLLYFHWARHARELGLYLHARQFG